MCDLEVLSSGQTLICGLDIESWVSGGGDEHVAIKVGQQPGPRVIRQ